MKHILVVDDEPRTREGVSKTLRMWASGEYEITTAQSGKEALLWLDQHDACLLLTDIRMPEMTGLELAEQITKLPHPPVIIILSGYSDFEYARSALKFGVVDYLLKPIEKNKLIQAVEHALEKEARNEQIDKMQKLIDFRLLQASQHNNLYNPHVQKALAYIEEHFHKQISLQQVADHLPINASYFSVLFKEQTGMTFSDYLTRHRIQHAKGLLTSTSLTITEIAEQAGYQTAKYFIKVFRMLEHTSPSQYRQQWLQDGQKIQ